jgi:hypothetical protein
MHASEHRFGENFKKNHSNTGQSPSLINRKEAAKERKTFWKKWYDEQ